MGYPSTPRLSVAVLVLASIVGCRSETASPTITAPPRSSVDRPATEGAAGNVLTVDDDRVQCPNADFTSIQSAVTAADPGSTILVCAGTYREQVTIAKNDLRLLAKGEPGDVVLDGLGLTTRVAGFFLNTAHGNLIEGFLLRNYHEASILLVGSNKNRIRKNTTTAADHDGIELIGSADNLIEHNVALDNPAANACGVNLAGGSARNAVRDNLAMNNEWGIQITGAATLNNEIFHNELLNNRGNGIRNVNSASGTIIEGNRAFRNGFTPGALTGAFASGIRIGSGTGINVTGNHAFDNHVVDLRNDAAAGATFDNNHCQTSLPAGLCEHTEGASHD